MKAQLKPIVLPVSGGIEGRIGGKWVTMSNALTRASHGLSLSEKRLIMMSVAQLDSRSGKSIQEKPLTTIAAAEYAMQFEVDINTAYDQLQAAARVLLDRKITFYKEAHNRKGEAIDPTKKQIRWIGSAEYNKGEGSVVLAWHWEIVPHLLNLKKQFTSYQLEQASALRSMYSWKMLELLMRFKSTGWAEYTIEDFSESMGATEKQRSNFNNIRRKIIEPAIRELTQKDGWVIDWEPIKKGRKVARLRFEFRRDEQLSLGI